MAKKAAVHKSSVTREETFKFTADMIGSEILERFSKDIYNPKAIVRELVSNAHDSYAQLEEYLTDAGEELDVLPEVRVDVADNSVIIADDGIGMNRADIDKLVSIALTDKRDMSGVRGYRGIGFWSAYTGGEQVVVETTKLGDNRLYRLTLDTKNMRERQTPNTSISSIMNDPACVQLESEPTLAESHGTKVIIIAETGEGRLHPLVNDPEMMRSVLLQGCACRIPESDDAVQLMPVYTSISAFNQEIGLKLPRLVFQGQELFKTYPGNLDGFMMEAIEIDVAGNRVELAKIWYATNQENERLDGPAAGIRVMRDGFPIGKQNLDSDRHLIGSNIEITRQDLLGWHVGEVHLLHPELRPDASGEGLPEIVLYTIFRERLRGIYDKLIERSYAKQRTKSLRTDYKKDSDFLAVLLTKAKANGGSLSADEIQRVKTITNKVENDTNLARGPLAQGTPQSDKKAYVRDDRASKLRRQLSATLKNVAPLLPEPGKPAPNPTGRKKPKPKAEPNPVATAPSSPSSDLEMTVFLSLIDEIRDTVVEVLKDDETLQNELLNRINQIVSTLQR